MNTRQRILMGVLPLIVLAAGVWIMIVLSGQKEGPQTQPLEFRPPLVAVVEAVPGDHALTVTAHGTVVPRTETDLLAEVAGRVLWVAPALAAGGFFDAHEVLLRLDPRDYELALAQARLNVATARRRLAEEQADAAVARREWADLGQGPGSPLVRHEPQLAESQAALEAAQAALQRAARDLDRTELRAPFAGRVRAKHADLGQFLGRGAPAARVYAVDWAEVRLPLPDRELAFLDLPLGFRGEDAAGAGPAVDLWCEFAGRRHRWPARIVRTEGEIDPRTRRVVAVARVEDPYGRGGTQDRPPLSVGLFVEAVIHGRTARGSFVLPREALRSADLVYVMDAENRLRFRRVEVLQAGRDEVVLASGLHAGERVVLTPLEVATDGMLLALPDGERSPR